MTTYDGLFFCTNRTVYIVRTLRNVHWIKGNIVILNLFGAVAEWAICMEIKMSGRG